MKKVELLIPAGDLERLKYAVMYGADAVYFGGMSFSLRAKASNFTLSDIKEGVKFAHEHNVKVYVTLNIVPHNEDFEGLKEYLIALNEIGIDGLIISSFAYLYFVSKYTKNIEKHISTQCSVINSEAIKFYEDLGVDRIVLGRELSLEELKVIKEKTKLKLEVFIHGGMCAGLSGRCILSNYMACRDANRGGCAHSCRWNYALKLDSGKEENFTMGSKDLCALRLIPEMIDIGIDSLKIEGRMKSVYYIASITRIYRALIDEYLKTGKINDFKIYEEELRYVESRETATGFLKGDVKQDEQYFDPKLENAPKNFLGKVLDFNPKTKEVTLEQRNHFKIGDEVEFIMPHKDAVSFIIDEMKNEEGERIEVAPHPLEVITFTVPFMLEEGTLMRKK
ncbi:MAG TPA: U32 family peptidase [Acholeplasma sp.]|nr:U32 family peptidase [Acholeplasma sp.]